MPFMRHCGHWKDVKTEEERGMGSCIRHVAHTHCGSADSSLPPTRPVVEAVGLGALLISRSRRRYGKLFDQKKKKGVKFCSLFFFFFLLSHLMEHRTLIASTSKISSRKKPEVHT